MTSQWSLGAAPAAPYVWCQKFEAAYDSPAGRWLAFGALNRLGPPQLRRLRLGQLGGMEEVSRQVNAQQWLWPSWMKDHFNADTLRLCPACSERGYHSVFHQIPLLTHCPWHRSPMTSACLHCGTRNAIHDNAHYLQPCCAACRMFPFPADARRYLRRPEFLAREEQAFGPMARALSHCRGVRVRFMRGIDERYPVTTPPAAAEILRALVTTERLPSQILDALLPVPANSQEAITIPLDEERDNGGLRRALDGFKPVGSNLPGTDSLDFSWDYLCAKQYCVGLRQEVVDGSGLCLQPPSSETYWMLALRAWRHDCLHYSSSGPRAAETSLRDRLLIQVPGRDVEWLVLRTMERP